MATRKTKTSTSAKVTKKNTPTPLTETPNLSFGVDYMEGIDAEVDENFRIGVKNSLNGVEIKTTVTKTEKHPTSTNKMPLDLLLGVDEKMVPKNLQFFAQYPFFTITEDKSIRKYSFSELRGDGAKEQIGIEMTPMANMALPTIADADLIIFLISSIREKAARQELPAEWIENRTVKIAASEYFRFLKIDTIGGANHKLFEESLKRLSGTRIQFSREILGEVEKLVGDKTRVVKNPRQIKNESILYNYFIEQEETRLSSRRSTRKTTLATITFSPWFWALIENELSLIAFDPDYVILSSFKKALYTKIKKSLGHQPFFRIKLINLALRLGVVTLSDNDSDLVEKQQKRALINFRRDLKCVIAENDMLDIAIAIEPAKKDFSEVVYFYHRDWRKQVSNVIDQHTSLPYTELELALSQRTEMIANNTSAEKMPLPEHFFRGLIHSAKMRELFKNDVKLTKKFMRDYEILRKGLAGEKLKPSQNARFNLLKRMGAMENITPEGLMASLEANIKREEPKKEVHRGLFEEG